MDYTFADVDDLKQFIADNLVDSVEVARLLGCSRQNVDDLVRRGKLIPLYASQRNRLYFRADVLERLK